MGELPTELQPTCVGARVDLNTDPPFLYYPIPITLHKLPDGRRAVGCAFLSEGNCSANGKDALRRCFVLSPEISRKVEEIHVDKLKFATPEDRIQRLQLLGITIKQQRESLGVLAKDLAEFAGVTPTYLWMVENAHPTGPKNMPSRPSMELLMKITQKLQLDPQVIFPIAGYKILE